MRTKHTIAGAAIAAAIALNLTAATARAATYGDPLIAGAHRVDEIAYELKNEFRLHYRDLGAYCHLVSDADAVIRRARHIDDLARDRHCSLRHIKADLVELDRLSHRMREVVGDAERGHYGRHAHCDTRRVHGLLASLDRSICGMTSTVDRMIHDAQYVDRRSRVHGDRYERGHHGGDHGDYRRGRSHSSRGVTYSYHSDRGFRIAISTGRR